GGPAGSGDLEHRIGAEAGDDPSLPPGLADGAVVLEAIAGRVRGGEDLDAEPLEQRPRPELGGSEFLRDFVVDPRPRLARQPVAHAEHLVQLVIEPGAGGRAPEQVVVVCEPLPHLARIGLDGRSIPARRPQRLERDAARVQQPQDVVVGLDDQRRGLGKGSSRARIWGSTWLWGETMGSRRVSSYSSRATRRTAG